MLSRHAQSLYWIGRYLERAGHLCRLLRLQSHALVDRPSVRSISDGTVSIPVWIRSRRAAASRCSPRRTSPSLIPLPSLTT